MQPQRVWREQNKRYRYEAGKCAGCGKIYFPARLICESCKSREFTTVTLPREGKILTYSVVHVAPSQFKTQAPYAIGVIELANSVRLTAQIVDIKSEDLKIGLPVKLEFRKVQEVGDSGVLCYGYKAVPA
jgi:uncharacterized OB-fold protein